MLGAEDSHGLGPSKYYLDGTREADAGQFLSGIFIQHF